MFNDPVGVLTVAQQKTVAAMLGQSFSQDPFMAYLMPKCHNTSTTHNKTLSAHDPLVPSLWRG